MSDVLIDTSVWRRYFANGSGLDALDDILREGRAKTHPWVLGELMLRGVSARAERLLNQLPRTPLVSDDELVQFIRVRKLQQRGIGWVDAQLLASALLGRAPLWTLDRDLASVAEELDVLFPGRG